MRLVDQAHQLIKPYIQTGDYTIDATVGNGHDTSFLAEHVGVTGKVFGFDLQEMAIEITTMILNTRKYLAQCCLMQQGHEHMENHIPSELHGQITAIMFNLGYLPHGDKNKVTRPQTTLDALKQSLALIKPEGVISILAYRGHEGGMEEFDAVNDWIQSQKKTLNCIYKQDSKHPEKKGPYFWLLQKKNP